MIRWRPILAMAVAELTLLIAFYPPPFGWKSELGAVLSSGYQRPNLMDPQTRLIVTEGRETVNEAGEIVKCFANDPSNHRNCHTKVSR